MSLISKIQTMYFCKNYYRSSEYDQEHKNNGDFNYSFQLLQKWLETESELTQFW